jgi:hypothetical protein
LNVSWQKVKQPTTVNEAIVGEPPDVSKSETQDEDDREERTIEK